MLTAKVMLLGDMGVGKTSILYRLIYYVFPLLVAGALLAVPDAVAAGCAAKIAWLHPLGRTAVRSAPRSVAPTTVPFRRTGAPEVMTCMAGA